MKSIKPILWSRPTSDGHYQIKIRIIEKSLQMNDINYDEELKKKKIFDFVNKYKNEIETIAINSQYWIKKIC